MESPQEGQSGGDVFRAFRLRKSNGVALEDAHLRTLAFGVQAAHDRATGQVANEAKIVAVRHYEGPGRDLLVEAQSQHARLHSRLRQHLAYELPSERSLAIVD
jgi:hypothetical protein